MINAIERRRNTSVYYRVCTVAFKYGLTSVRIILEEKTNCVAKSLGSGLVQSLVLLLSTYVILTWASLLAQMVLNPPAMQETWVQSQVGKISWERA